ncbi:MULTISPECIES: DUF1648 domain-containing protein [Glycomyces]|uniref:Membrane protein n=2 Tax=Glycomyces TaxID=58113 RepID=A0A9X3PIR1_9ACTN|nr:hypothetical protein [Glycomyces lechevalierae]MDA1383632.1 hypothetical protein [Glycomyces lechevalierae]MDR7341378.1 putative membrane protein [Glycomyces lechevalierae]
MTLPLITLLVAIALVTAVWRSVPALARPSLPFGVAVPPDRVADPAIAQARDRFSRTVLASGAIAAALALPLALLLDPEPVIAAAVTALALADTAAYTLAGRRVRAAKAAGDWYAGAKQAVTADLTFRTDPVRVPWHWALPAVLVLAATIAIGLARAGSLPATLPGLDGVALDGGPRVPTCFLAAANPVLAQAAITLAVPLLLAAIVKSRPEIDAARPADSARRYRVYLRALAGLLLFAAACANLTLLGIALRLWEILPPSVPATVVIFTPLLALAVAAVALEIRVGAGGHRLPGGAPEDTGLVQRDDDRHWHLAGFVYANRDDPAVLVHQRAGGLQWTVNLGHPVGWGVTALLALIAAAAIGAAALDGLGIVDLPNTRGL